MNETPKILESGIHKVPHFCQQNAPHRQPSVNCPSPPTTALIGQSRHPFFIPSTFRTHSFLPWRRQQNVTQTQWPQSTIQ